MEKIVISYNVSDGCTYSCTVTEAVSYESVEAVYVELFDAIKETLTQADVWKGQSNISFNGKSFELNDFYELMDKGLEKHFQGSNDMVYNPHTKRYYLISMPEIQTLEDWFNSNLTNY